MNNIKISVVEEIRNQKADLSKFSNESLCDFFFMQPSSLRLTYLGYSYIKHVFTGYKFETKMKHQHLITLSNMMKYPYYINSSHDEIVIFTETDAMMINLCGGIEKYLENNV